MPGLVNADALCSDWRVYRPRKGDKLTDASSKEMIGNNKSREVWGCKKLENEAAS